MWGFTVFTAVMVEIWLVAGQMPASELHVMSA